MVPSVEAILKDYDFQPELLQRVAVRKTKPSIEIVPPNPEWPQIFEGFKARIVAGLGAKALAIVHSGSTSIPGLPSKDVIDIDLVVADPTDEDSYVSGLEAAGFQFLAREPHWHEHRFFSAYEPKIANLHVWGPDSPELVRHRIFRERLMKSEEDKALYVGVKEEAARHTRGSGGIMMDYNNRKQEVIRQILRRAFIDLGYIQ